MSDTIRPLHKRTIDKTPTASDVLEGEIVLNYGENTEGIFIKNNKNVVKEFKSIDYVFNMVTMMIDEAIINTLNTPV